MPHLIVEQVCKCSAVSALAIVEDKCGDVAASVGVGTNNGGRHQVHPYPPRDAQLARQLWAPQLLVSAGENDQGQGTLAGENDQCTIGTGRTCLPNGALVAKVQMNQTRHLINKRTTKMGTTDKPPLAHLLRSGFSTNGSSPWWNTRLAVGYSLWLPSNLERVGKKRSGE
eukprot:7015767-Pyramimonas_sp.AAC.1